ncbi:VOC family protein, partial [Ilumatobacter sp.]|uniref:VOC family protein n=1 Tax=Ilumatobacter sp. TaxID=1967498 RepID=UPI003AF41997
MEHTKLLRQAVLLAIEAGDGAAAATHRIATGNSDPDDTGTGLRGRFERWARHSGGPAVTRTQVERTCVHLDDFVTALGDVNDHVATAEERIDTSHDWRTRLQESTRAAADIHNEVTATLAILGRYRTDIVLGRPLLDSDRGGAGAIAERAREGGGASPRITWTTVCIDCDDAERLAEFYCRLLGWEVTARDPRGWVQARDPDGGVGLNFQSEPWYR